MSISGAGVEVNLGSDDIKTIYTIDGEEVENPLQEASVCLNKK